MGRVCLSKMAALVGYVLPSGCSTAMLATRWKEEEEEAGLLHLSLPAASCPLPWSPFDQQESLINIAPLCLYIHLLLLRHFRYLPTRL